MKKILLLFLILPACKTVKDIPYKNSYIEQPYQIIAKKTIDEVWKNVLNTLAANKISTHYLDKANGLIVSDQLNIKWTTEDKDGYLKNADALVLVPRVYNKANRTITPSVGFNGNLTGELNIGIKSENNKTIITTNIVNIKKAQFNHKNATTQYVPYTNYKSTGFIEHQIETSINK